VFLPKSIYRGLNETDRIQEKEQYTMAGDLAKAPKVVMGSMLEDMANLQKTFDPNGPVSETAAGSKDDDRALPEEHYELAQKVDKLRRVFFTWNRSCGIPMWGAPHLHSIVVM